MICQFRCQNFQGAASRRQNLWPEVSSEILCGPDRDGGLWPGIFVLRIPSQICGWREIKFHIFWDQRQLLLILVWNYLLCLVAQLFLTLCDPMDCSLPNLSVHGQEFWSRLPFPSPEDLPDPRIEPTSLVSCIGRWFFTTSAIWEALCLSVVTV